MSGSKRYDFADGKYTIIRDFSTYRMTALRYGEDWGRDLTGDNLIASMLDEIDRLHELNDSENA